MGFWDILKRKRRSDSPDTSQDIIDSPTETNEKVVFDQKSLDVGYDLKAIKTDTSSIINLIKMHQKESNLAHEDLLADHIELKRNQENIPKIIEILEGFRSNLSPDRQPDSPGKDIHDQGNPDEPPDTNPDKLMTTLTDISLDMTIKSYRLSQVVEKLKERKILTPSQLGNEINIRKQSAHELLQRLVSMDIVINNNGNYSLKR